MSDRQQDRTMKAYEPSSTDGQFSERANDTIIRTPPVASSVVNMTNPTPAAEDFDA